MSQDKSKSLKSFLNLEKGQEGNVGESEKNVKATKRGGFAGAKRGVGEQKGWAGRRQGGGVSLVVRKEDWQGRGTVAVMPKGQWIRFGPVQVFFRVNSGRRTSCSSRQST